MADDEAITSKTITTAQWLKFIKPIPEDFAADRQIQEEAWLSGSSKLYSPIEMICTLMDNFSFARVVTNPSSREVADLSAHNEHPARASPIWSTHSRVT